MTTVHKFYVKNDLIVDGAIRVANIIDTQVGSTLQLGSSTSTKIELTRSTIPIEMKGPLTASEGVTVTGSATVSQTLAVGQATSADASSVLEMTSTTKGVLFPRMTTTQRNAISSPSAGLLVYDTTVDAVFVYNGVWGMLIKNKVDDSNIIVGVGSGDAISTGNLFNIILGKNTANLLADSDNVIIGHSSAGAATSASGNVVVGKSSAPTLSTGDNNIMIGNASGGTLSTGSNNTMIGASTAGSATLSNQTSLGYQATSDKANQVMIGNSSVIEMVPHASATANLGTASNPWNNVNIKGVISFPGGTTISETTIKNIGSGVLTKTDVSTATYTILSTDVILSCKYSTTGEQTLTLPAASATVIGKTYHIVDVLGNAYVNNIIIQCNGADTINGESSATINGNYQSFSIFCDSATSWFIF